MSDKPLANINLPIIGVVHSPLIEKFAIPRQSGLVDVPAQIEMFAPFDNPQAFVGLEQFSHIWLLWHFHQNKPHQNKPHQNKPHQNKPHQNKQHHNKPHQNKQQQNTSHQSNVHSAKFRPQIRPPRLGGNQKIGVFASRSMYRPANIGLSVVKLQQIEQVNNRIILHILGADMVHGTPIVDIKPYIKYADSVLDASSGYASEAPQLLCVTWSMSAMMVRTQFEQMGYLSATDVITIEALLAQDPRPAYKADSSKVERVAALKQSDRSPLLDSSSLDFPSLDLPLLDLPLQEYGMRYGRFNIRFNVQHDTLNILSLYSVD